MSALSQNKLDEINSNLSDITAQRAVIKAIGTSSFDDGLMFTTGSEIWRALLVAAKALYDEEKKARTGADPSHCLLCRQVLSEKETRLFQKYWDFLSSKAESQLENLLATQESFLSLLGTTKSGFPRFDDSLSAVKILRRDDPEFLTTLATNFRTLEGVLDEWLANMRASTSIDGSAPPRINLDTISNLSAAKRLEASELVDPAAEIASYTAELIALGHKRQVTELKAKALKYLEYLRWTEKVNGVSFSAVKTATTKQRKTMFLAGVAEQYTDCFNRTLSELGCDRELVMWTSGEQGSTVKEFKLSFTDDHVPSQILSEGEQNVCALADFLTEVTLDSGNCGIIFDDPVTSLDHERKSRIAERLVRESKHRQVVVFTHDPVFMTKLARASEDEDASMVTHWMRVVNKTPGNVDVNSSPKISTTAKQKDCADRAVKDFEALDGPGQELALGGAFDYLRSACEALIEEKLFGKAIQRYEDHIKVQNLEDAVFDQQLALRVVNLHGEISESLLSHNRSSQMREQPPTLEAYKKLRTQLDEIEVAVNIARKAAIAAREARRKARVGNW